MTRTQEALATMAEKEPELAARLVLQMLPAAAAQIPGQLTYDLEVDGMGTWRVHVADGAAQVTPAPDGANGAASNGAVDFHLHTDPRTLAEMAAGASPARLMLRGRMRIRGKRRRAMKLRAMGASDPSIEEVARAGGHIDPDLLYRGLAYLIDPAWTRGHAFEISYSLTGEGGGRWYIAVRDGQPLSVAREPHGTPDATVTTDMGTFHALLSGAMAPDQALQRQLTDIEGDIYPVTIFGRWIERSQGRDDDELRREEAQRAVHARRAGTWGATNGAGPAAAPGQGDPAHESEGKRRQGGELLSYGELYALWERQNWRAHELDFSVDREHFLATPSEAQQNLIWSLGSFYIGEERVTADLAPFLLAAPTGEIEAFLSTQLVDEARHAVFFDRFGAEVMALKAEDFRGRMEELERTMLHPWHDVFDDGLRAIANRIKERPDDIDLFVEGITTYHVVIEGVLAMTGQRFIIKYMEDHGLYPGFREGFSLVERDEHRHIAFGVRFLKEMVDADRARFGPIIERRVAELVPKAVHVFVPPYADSAERFVSYGYRSEHLYGYAYRALKRRMGVIGLEVPSAEDLMPGPIATPDVARAAGAPA